MKAINNGKRDLNLESGRCRRDKTCDVTPAEMGNLRQYFVQPKQSIPPKDTGAMDEFLKEFHEYKPEEGDVPEASNELDEFGPLKGTSAWMEIASQKRAAITNKRRIRDRNA